MTIPGYKFSKAKRWNDIGSSTLLATGFDLKSGSHVLAKIAPAHSNSAICLGREVIINNQLSSMPEGTRIALSLLETLTIPKAAGDCEVVIYHNPGFNALGRYFPPGTINDLLLPWHPRSTPSSSHRASSIDANDGKRNRARRERLSKNLYGLKVADFDVDMDSVGFLDPTEAEKDSEDEAQMEVDDTAMQSTTTIQGLSAPRHVSRPSGSEPWTPADSLSFSNAQNSTLDVMDLASFLEFAIHSTHCLEILHKSGHKHREVRANAFHVNMHTGAVRFAHFGNRSESLEKTGGPSQLVLRASGLIPSGGAIATMNGMGNGSGEEVGSPREDVSGLDAQTGNVEDDDARSDSGDIRKVKEAICYLAPEQTGTAETNTEDHRTDLYALGVLFWTMLVGHGTLPFDGSPVEMLHKVVQSKPREVHEVRQDVPPVISAIVSKLLSKSPDGRYNSAIGLKNDLMECQKRLTLSCANAETSGTSSLREIELIPSFELGQHDVFLELTIPGDLFGREKEMQQIRSVIRSVAAAASAQVHTVEATLMNARVHPLAYDYSSFSFMPSTSNPETMSTTSLALSNISVGYSNASVGRHDSAPHSQPGSPSGNALASSSASTNGTTPHASHSRKISSSHLPAGMSMTLDKTAMNGTVKHEDENQPETPDASAPKANIFERSVVKPGPGGVTQKEMGVGTMMTDASPISASAVSVLHRPNGFPPLGSSSVVNSTISHSIHSHGTSNSLSTMSGSPASIRAGRTAQAHAIVIVGQAGIGKSSLIQMNQAYWRRQGLWGHAKMVKGDASPFTAVLTCLSSVLRQLMMFQNDRQAFVQLLKARLGAQLLNIPLLFHGVPELRDLLAAFGIVLAEPKVMLSTEELGARFQSLVECVYGTLADVKLLALFLDDIHFADKATLELIGLLSESRSRILIMTTCRDDDLPTLARIRRLFASRTRTTWIQLLPLDNEALGSLVSTTLQRPKEDIAPLIRLVSRVSGGNPFLARNLLQTVWRLKHIWYEWGVNSWQYDLEAIEKTVHAQQLVSAPTDISFLVAHFRELSKDAQRYLIWASIFGPMFKANDVANMMDSEKRNRSDEDESGSAGSSSDHEADGGAVHPTGYSRPSMRGLQQVVGQGWIIPRARDMCSFTHDKYRQAATHMAGQLPDITIMRMCLKIATYLMQEPERDVFRITEYARRCIPLIREGPDREEFIECLVQAADSSAARGAHELALQAFKDARTLLGEGSWHENPEKTKDLTLKLAELYGSQGNYESSGHLVAETLLHVNTPEDRAHALRLRSRNRFVQKDFTGAYSDTCEALAALGTQLPTVVTIMELDEAFDLLKAKIIQLGFDELLNLPRATDQLTDLVVSLMSDAATNAFWGAPFGVADFIGIKMVNLALSDGISPSTAQGLLWCLGGAAERRQMYRFCSDLAKLALQIAYRFGNIADKCRCETLYCAMISGFAPEHIKTVMPRMESAITEARSSGDRVYEGFARCHGLSQRVFCSDHLSELLLAAEEVVHDVRAWTVNSDTNSLAMSMLMTIRALAGETNTWSADTAFDTDKWKEAHFLHKVHESSGNFELVMNWYNSFKIAGLYSLGFHSRAAELGFDIYASRLTLPSHRHVRYALFFHSLAMIQCLRHGSIPPMQQEKYMKQIEANQRYIRAWVSPSPINNSVWHALIEAELASLQESPEAFKLYDSAIKMAVNQDWIMEEAWALYLEGSHFIRSGVEGLGAELQARGIARHRQWGAFGIVNHLNRHVPVSTTPLKRNIFSSEAGVQTDGTQTSEIPVAAKTQTEELGLRRGQDATSILTASDLADVLKWSQSIASDINLTSSLQRLTEIATEHSNAQEAVFVMRTDEGDYNVVTSQMPPQPCIVFEQPKSVRRIGDSLKRAVLQHCLNSRAQVFFTDSGLEPRFAQEAGQSRTKSVICIPFANNLGQTYGALYLGSHESFSQTHVALLTLLSQQASISIANALLFRSVQQATKANLQMIQTQIQALEEAQSSREDAMKATKIKSNFLASMSHELRTPFSSFYGLLDILGGTSLDANQKELVQTAKQSCELLLKIIDSILDYSKLEASALKLEPVPFLVEDVVADCVELLLPLAARKLDLSFEIAADVPYWALGDYSRIRQVLMNLLANGLKFCERGSVSTTCTVDPNIPCKEDEVVLKWVVQDTGIGMSEADMKNLWQPFSQADNSSTRRFGGTGLGLSISLSLVKLMGGDIGVTSQPGVGSRFWFHIPMKVLESAETKKSEENLETLLKKLRDPLPLRILISSPSDTTRSWLSTILNQFEVVAVASLETTIQQLRQAASAGTTIDFLILDYFSQSQLEEIARILDAHPVFSSTKAIHLYTPTPLAIQQIGDAIRQSGSAEEEDTTDRGTIDMALASATGFASTQRREAQLALQAKAVSFGRFVRMNKPPRRARLLQLLANLKDIPVPDGGFTGSQIEQALESMESSQELLKTANVLIAEDNPVANKLLVKQLQKYDLNVVSTMDGSEAVQEWEKRPPGYFHFALFDHHMPICDGVEAAKRIRNLEWRKRAKIHLPIIALSADCQESTKELCLSAGMTGFLTKPVRPGDLPNLLRAYGTPREEDIRPS